LVKNMALRARREKLIAVVPKFTAAERDVYSKIAIGTGFAECLEGHMAAGTAGRATYTECAKEAKLKEEYKAPWRSS